MAKAAEEHRHGKPKKPEYVSPKKPFRKLRKAPLAAIVTAAILATPGAAKAGTVAPLDFQRPSSPEKASPDSSRITRPDFSPSINGEYAFNEGTATIEFTHTNIETLDATYRILFNVDGERYSPRFRFNAPPPNALGSIVGLFVSEIHTAVLTDNYLVVTQGYNDSFQNPDTLLMRDGSRLNKNSFPVRLPQGLRGGNIVSCAAASSKNDISALFALGGGKLWSFRPDVQDGSPVSIDISAPGTASLHSYKGYVFLFQPDSTDNFISIFRRDADGISSVGSFRAERSDSAQASDAPSAREVPGGMMFSSGNRTLILLFDEGTNTFTTAAPARD